jgi:hypothetical protein
MIPKKYSSFREINNDLRILKLQQEIDKESLRLNYRRAKSSFSPTNLLGGFGGIIQTLLISLVAKKVLKKLS